MEDARTPDLAPVPARAGWQGALDRHFTPIAGGLCLLYLAIEVAYVQRMQLSMDEFQGAHTVYQLKGRLPYAQFTPYKTVLGYYLQLPFLLLSDDLWERILWVKRGMACINAAVLFVVARSLGRTFERGAVVLSLAALLAMSTFLERSSELRVDMLTAAAGLLSFAWLLERRFVAAGLAAGVSFLVSQKGAYYCIAGGVAIASHFWVVDRRRERLFDAARYALPAAAVLVVYVVAWSIVASSTSVAKSTLVKAASTALSMPYTTLWKYWYQTLERNPYFYAAALLGIGVSFESALRTARRRDWIVWTYAGSVFALCVWHKQPWPYFFVLLVPTLWIPIAFLFERLDRRSVLYWLLFLGLGLGFPLSRVPHVLAHTNDHQRHAVRVTERLLDPDETYLAGLHMVLSRGHAPASLAWLDKKGIARVKAGRSEQVLAELREKPPKVVVWTYRLESLPIQVRRFLQSNYDRLSGWVRVYAPYVVQRRFEIAYAGKYRLAAATSVVIDDRKVRPRDHVRLAAGSHRANRSGFRLVWTPPRSRLDPSEKLPPGGRSLFDAVYAY